MLFGQGSGIDLTKTLHIPHALGVLNSTIRPNPSCSKDDVALEYSGSVMTLGDLLPCLKHW